MWRRGLLGGGVNWGLGRRACTKNCGWNVNQRPGPYSSSVFSSLSSSSSSSSSSSALNPNHLMSLDKWKANNIFKDVLDEFKASVVVNMQYGSTQIHDGDEMRPAKCADAPSVVFKGQAEKKYTVIMTDPDPPSPTDPKFREWLHWIVVNIPGEKGDVTSGKTVVEYNPPAPPRGTHRYVLIILEQSGEVHAQAPKERKFFKTKTFAKDHSLTPVGGIFYVAQP